eukprot:666572-Pelagomonas_calceolata.AAC.1
MAACPAVPCQPHTKIHESGKETMSLIIVLLQEMKDTLRASWSKIESARFVQKNSIRRGLNH